MRIRTVKPAFWKSETLAQIGKEHRLLAIALLNYADDAGYFQAHEALVRGECFPFDEDSASCQRGIAELSRIGFIRLGTSEFGQRVGQVTNFLGHQKIDKPTHSKYVAISITWDGVDHNSTNPPRILDEPSPTDREGKGKGRGVRKTKTPIPETFGLSTRVIDWATSNGFGHLQEHLDHFRLKAAANDYRYVDWDAAFMSAIKGDWAKVNAKALPADQFRGAV